MALNIKIDVKNCYEFLSIDEDLRHSTFESPICNDTCVRMGIKISTDAHPYMPNVYNLAFGPVNKYNEIDDNVKLPHRNHSMVFSTITLAAASFLAQNPGTYLGIDGSDTRRAYMYYRCILNNFVYLNDLFAIFGVNYYLRIRRDSNGDYERDDFFVFPSPIQAGEKICPSKLYNYLIFKLR